MNALRHAYGLRWQRDRLSRADLRDYAKTAAAAAFFVVAALIGGALDYAAEQRREADAQADAARALSAALAACLSGTARFITPGEHAHGDQLIAIACRAAEEIRL